VAVPVPAALRDLLAVHLERCARLASGFRWVRPEGLHLTLRFVGGIDSDLVERLGDRLEHVRQPPFELALAGPGRFGSDRRARVVWLGVGAGSEALARLAGAIEAGCRDAGLPGEARAFNPHLTLARSRPRAGLPVPDLPGPPGLHPWIVDEFQLYRSQPHPGGAVYSTLRSFPLTRPSPPA
jgi:2'-5' RNA ligase